MPKAERVESHVWHGRNLKDRQRNGTRWQDEVVRKREGGGRKGVCLALPERVREPRHTLACQFHVQWQKVIHLVIFYLYMFSPPSPPSCCPAPWPILSAYLFWADNATRQRRQFSIALSRIPFMPFSPPPPFSLLLLLHCPPALIKCESRYFNALRELLNIIINTLRAQGGNRLQGVATPRSNQYLCVRSLWPQPTHFSIISL